MKQHPIPQNILDVEFKLFTKFTVKEFAYIAIGVGFGGIFLYLFTRGQLPAIVAFPIFIISSGAGLFLGLVPVNEQKADVFLKNYVTAITSPTQRVWMDRKLKSKLKPAVSPNTTGTMDRTAQEKATIVGGTENSAPQNQFIQKAAEHAEVDEAARLQAIEQAAASAETPTQSQQNRIVVGKQNAKQYATNLPGVQSITSNVNLRLVDRSGLPVPQAVATIKDQGGRVIGTAKSDDQGNVLYQRPLPQGQYAIDIQSGSQRFPRVDIVIEDQNLPPIKVTAI